MFTGNWKFEAGREATNATLYLGLCARPTDIAVLTGARVLPGTCTVNERPKDKD